MRNLLHPLLSAALALALAAPGFSQVTPSPQVAALRKQASQLATAGKNLQAAQKLAEARVQVRAERRQASGALPRPQVDPRYQKELKSLSAQVKAKYRKAPRTAAARAAAIREYEEGKRALDRKYQASLPSKSAINRRTEETLRIGARYQLLEADLGSEQADYLEKGGNRPTAARLRQQALLQRLDAYRTLQKPTEAGQIATRLLRLNPSDPQVFRAVAEFQQESQRFSDAAETWRRGLALLESGRGEARARAQDRAYFYRQLAFAYSKAGKPAESRQALDRALQLERGGR